MQTIQISNSYSSQFNTDFNQVNTIEIEDASLDEGKFGVLYKCISINGQPTKQEQIIKIFKKEGENHSYKTIENLQEKVIRKNSELKRLNELELQNYPIFKAFPQLRFEGTMRGESVKGYSANFLSGDFVSCEAVWPDKDGKYHHVKEKIKLLCAYNLVKGFEILRGLNYIHSDINPLNMFLNLTTGDLVLIDYDSGCVTDSNQDKPITIGKSVDPEWLAPQIKEAKEASANEFKVDFDTELWSVTVGVHYILFGCLPFSFLDGGGGSFLIVKEYLSQDEWPRVSYTYKDFIKGEEKFHKNYIKRFDKLNGNLRACLSKTLNSGYLLPKERTPYVEWTKVLAAMHTHPEIVVFESNPNTVLGKTMITVKWKVKGAIKIFLNGQDVPSQGSQQFEISKDTSFSLSSQNIFGKTVGDFQVQFRPLPTFDITPSTTRVKEGGKVKFNWTSTNVSNVIMLNAQGVQSADIFKGNQFSTPQLFKDSEFTFKAIGEFGGEITKTFKIEVYQKVRIVSFEASRNLLMESQPVTISWTVENAQMILLNGQDVTQEKQMTYYPDRTTLYVLEAKNIYFEDFKDAQTKHIKVIALPKAPVELAKINLPLLGLTPPQYSDIIKPISALENELSVINKSTLRGKTIAWFLQLTGKLKLYKEQKNKPLIEMVRGLNPQQLYGIVGGRNEISKPNFSFQIDNKTLSEIIREAIKEELNNIQDKNKG